MIATFSTQDLDFKSRFGELLKRGAMDICNVEERVKNLLYEIKENGENAIVSHIAKFDLWNPKSLEELKITQDSMQKAYESLQKPLKDSLQKAYERIFAFHSKQKPKTWFDFEEN